MADKKADTASLDLMARQEYGKGSLFQKCEARFGCPPLDADGKRPKHDCQGRWFGMVEGGFTASGGRRRITVSGKKKGVVERRLRDKRNELEREGKRNVKRTITVAKWAGEWLEGIERDVTPGAYQTDVAAVRSIVAAIGSVKLIDVDPGDVKAVDRHVRGQGNSSSTSQRYHGSLMRMLTAASLHGYAIQPNVLLTKKPTAAVNDRDAIRPDQSMRVLDYLFTLPHGHDLIRRGSVSRWALAFLQGHRSAESRGLTWPTISLTLGAESLTISWQVKSLTYIERGNVEAGFRIPDGYEARHLVGATHLVRPKSKAGWRVQPLVDFAAASLREWYETAPDNPHALVWPGRSQGGKTWPRNAASDLAEWHAIQTAVGIAHPNGRPYHVHEIRHGTATLLQELGVDEATRIAIMGHSAIASTRTYEHVDLEPMRKALTQAAGRLRLQLPG